MDTLGLMNACLAGFFAFAGVHYSIQWWLSRSERILLLFAVQCALYTAFCCTMVMQLQAPTLPQVQSAVDRVITVGVLAHGLVLQFYVYVGGRRDRVFRALVWGVLALLVAYHQWVPLRGTVVELQTVQLPGLGTTLVPIRTSPSAWLPLLYLAVLTIQAYGLFVARVIWERDRSGALLVAVGAAAMLGGSAIAFLVDFANLRAPYAGAAPHALFVICMALFLAREYAARRAQAALSKRQFETVLEHAPIGMAVLAADGRLLSVNRALCRMLGTTAEALSSRRLQELTHGEDGEADEAEVQRLLAGETQTYTGEKRFLRQDGAPASALLAVSVMPDDEGRPPRFIAQMQDVTELRGHRQRELRAMAQLETISTLLIPEGEVEMLYERILDAAITSMGSDGGTFQVFHPERGPSGELQLLTYRGLDPKSMAYWEWVPPSASSSCGMALRTRERSIIADTETHEFDEIESRALFRELGSRAMQSTPLISRSGTLLGMLSTHWRQPHQPSQQDLRLLDVLARQAADLIDRTRTAQALRERNAELAEQDRRKDLFLATLGHELRNPLAVLDLSAQLLRNGEDREKVQAMLEQYTQQLTTIVSDLLDVSRITRGKLELHKEPVDLAALVDAVLDVWRVAIREKQQKLTTYLPERMIVEVDPVRFEQVLANLLSNAMKYTPPQGAIHVQLSEEADDLVLSVSDSGQGLRAEDLRAIFEPFIQINPETGGLGIGLSVAKGLVELHGGMLSVESSGVGAGSTFLVRLPRGSARDLPIERPAQLLRLPPDLRVLVVDDIAEYARGQVSLLRALGCQPTACQSGREALRCVADLRPHVVLLDLGLPEMSGYEVAERLRQEAAVDNLWIIAVSGYGDRGVEARAKAAGFDRLLTKPVRASVLHELLRARAAEGL